MLEYNVATCRYALMNVRTAFEKFFEKRCRYPKFKSKKDPEQKFKVTGDRVSFHGENNRYVHIPGMGRRREDFLDCGNHRIPVGPNITYHNVYIKRDACGDYWLSLSVELSNPIDFFPLTEGIGIDLGFRNPAALSNGTLFDPPDRHRLGVLDNRKRKIQSSIGKQIARNLSIARSTKTKYKDVPISKNQEKRLARYRKTHRQIANIYKTHYHKVSREIANLKPEFVVLEDLDIRAMQKQCRPTSHYVFEARMGMLAEFIDYKCTEYGAEIIYADRMFPSTKTCSRCGFKREKMYGGKTFVCPMCGLHIDRDLNAAINLRNYGLKVRSSAQ